MARIPQQLNFLALDYIKSQIDTGQPGRVKRALQELCRYVRQGHVIHPDQLFGIENATVGLLATQHEDPKVIRWSLNALALFGRARNSLEAVSLCLRKFSNDPEIVASAVAAIYKLSQSPVRELADARLDDRLITLAALQHVPSSRVNLRMLPLDIEKSSIEHLKLALILAGLDKAPRGIFAGLSIRKAVHRLGSHEDPIVSQYSVWAITENLKFTVKDLGIKIKDIEGFPPNVRAWVFRLLGMRPADAIKNQQYLAIAPSDPEVEPRSGLAEGLRETYFDGLDAIVMPWVLQEPTIEVRSLLLEHMTQQADRSSSYRKHVLECYEAEPEGSTLRRRLQVAASRTALFAELQNIRSPDMFERLHKRDILHVTKNTFNIQGGIQAPGGAFGGDAHSSGMNNQFNNQMQQTALAHLATARENLEAIAVEGEANLAKEEAIIYVKAAEAQPTQDNITRAIEYLEKFENTATAALGAGTAAGGIVTALRALLGL